ncbi:MAG: hypothetical protein KJN97_09255 [Deltaproteobacteria bacterium]|nr:hypothetical protein [Deltaproteobacteria bacterium]
MTEKLELVREEKLYRLLPGKKKGDRLEASGVALVDDSTAAVIFDSLNVIARVHLSLEPNEGNRLIPAPSLGEGFEDLDLVPPIGDSPYGGVRRLRRHLVP